MNQTINALGQIRYAGGTTHTNDALELVRTSVLTQLNGDRPNAENVVLVVSDGNSNEKVDTLNEANMLHAVSDDVISIVIGSGKVLMTVFVYPLKQIILLTENPGKSTDHM